MQSCCRTRLPQNEARKLELFFIGDHIHLNFVLLLVVCVPVQRPRSILEQEAIVKRFHVCYDLTVDLHHGFACMDMINRKGRRAGALKGAGRSTCSNDSTGLVVIICIQFGIRGDHNFLKTSVKLSSEEKGLLVDFKSLIALLLFFPTPRVEPNQHLWLWGSCQFFHPVTLFVCFICLGSHQKESNVTNTWSNKSNILILF